jgi:hypothetical protein
MPTSVPGMIVTPASYRGPAVGIDVRPGHLAGVRLQLVDVLAGLDSYRVPAEIVGMARVPRSTMPRGHVLVERPTPSSGRASCSAGSSRSGLRGVVDAGHAVGVARDALPESMGLVRRRRELRMEYEPKRESVPGVRRRRST